MTALHEVVKISFILQNTNSLTFEREENSLNKLGLNAEKSLWLLNGTTQNQTEFNDPSNSLFLHDIKRHKISFYSEGYRMSNGVAYLITIQVTSVQGTARYVIILIVEKRPNCIFVISRDFFSKHCCKFLVICY